VRGGGERFGAFGPFFGSLKFGFEGFGEHLPGRFVAMRGWRWGWFSLLLFAVFGVWVVLLFLVGGAFFVGVRRGGG